MKNTSKFIFIFLFLSKFLFAQNLTERSLTEQFGKMYSFHNIPIEKINLLYNVNLNSDWYSDVMKGALQLGNGCSASFVSTDGLIMTNHHCVRDAAQQVQQNDENFLENGFYAENLFNERKIPGLFVDQLISVENITNKILTDYVNSLSDLEKRNTIKLKIDSIETNYSKTTKFNCKVVPLYGGAKYLLHYYKRYSDIRLVMLPEFQIASTGWDWDNFTYPRYELDFAFLRAYDEKNNPAKTIDMFKFSTEGAKENEPIFVIGRPGNTDRLYSSYQLEYLKKFGIAKKHDLLKRIYNVYLNDYLLSETKNQKMLNNLMGVGNSKKAYDGMFNSLNENKLFDTKKRLEEFVKQKMFEDGVLAKKYGHIFENFESTFSEYKKLGNEFETLQNLTRSQVAYWNLSLKIAKYIKHLRSNENLNKEVLKDDEWGKIKTEISQIDITNKLQKELFASIIEYLIDNLGKNNSLFNCITSTDTFISDIINNSFLSNKNNFISVIESHPVNLDGIDDPLLNILSNFENRLKDLTLITDRLNGKIENLNRQFSEILFAVFGENIAPDATATLRITDGTIKGYEYNGTKAPANTTYFGMFDRYYSFGGNTYPWGLPKNWINKKDFINFTIPLNFCSTNDIVGGNSGSAAINDKKEVVGLIFDGNYESLAGYYYYDPSVNRAVGINSRGLIYALQNIYGTKKLVEELINGKR